VIDLFVTTKNKKMKKYLLSAAFMMATAGSLFAQKTTNHLNSGDEHHTAAGTKPPGTVTAIRCDLLSNVFGPVIQRGIPAGNGVQLPYEGGSGIVSTIPLVIPSTGVTGLSLTVYVDNLVLSGNSSVYGSINGTATASGNANFAISFGGKSCVASVFVY
jgi:hypothetical protein